MSTGSDKRICVVCAWRENCTKRYRVKVNALFDVNCPDYTRDIKLKEKDVDILVDDQIMRWQKEKKEKPGHVITLSSETGAGGGRVARVLATELCMNIVGSDLIQKVAESAHMSDKVIKSLDEKSYFVFRQFDQFPFLRRATSGPMNICVICRWSCTPTPNMAMSSSSAAAAASFLKGTNTFRVRIIGPEAMRVEKVIARSSPVSSGCTGLCAQV